MKRALAGGFELDDDRERVDGEAVHRFVSASYWALGRSRAVMDELIRTASRVVGLYAADGRQVGFARVVSDEHTMSYLADVYVLPEHRGRGLGTELVRAAVDDGPYHDLLWLLLTRDAHRLYETVGFERPSARLMWRPGARTRGPRRPGDDRGDASLD